jgi:hypothetical protein
LDGLFDRLGHGFVKPVVVKRLFGPDLGLEDRFEFVFAAFAELPGPNMPIGAAGDGVVKDSAANITIQCFHKNSLLYKKFYAIPCKKNETA